MLNILPAALRLLLFKHYCLIPDAFALFYWPHVQRNQFLMHAQDMMAGFIYVACLTVD